MEVLPITIFVIPTLAYTRVYDVFIIEHSNFDFFKNSDFN